MAKVMNFAPENLRSSALRESERGLGFTVSLGSRGPGRAVLWEMPRALWASVSSAVEWPR